MQHPQLTLRLLRSGSGDTLAELYFQFVFD
jgi:hypothetical protein